MTEPGIGLYLHIPWCVRKCPYCDFNSHATPHAVPVDRYVAALRRDLEEDLARCGDRTVNTVFIGGGTPSVFPPEAIALILDCVRKGLRVTGDAEITMEANPGTIERGRFSGYRDAGINRVSLGAQSFSDGSLRALGRIHTAAETGTAIEELVAAGIDNFNVDLMYALPGQSVGDAIDDLRLAMSFAPSHISHYQLTLEPGTVFFHRPPPLPDDDHTYTMQQAARDELASAGYQHYEVSAFARPGRQCRHNLNYWNFGDYLGLGAGAHGKMTLQGTVWRAERLRSPAAYLAALEEGRSPVTMHEVIPEDLPFEFMLNALRLRRGFAEPEFQQATGLPFSTIAAGIKRLVARGLMEWIEGRWAATLRGFDFLNDVQSEFLADRHPLPPRAVAR